MENAPSIDARSIVQLAWIACLALVIVLIPFTSIAVIAFRRALVGPGNNPAVTFSHLFERAKGLQMITVILIVLAAAFLALIHIIDANGVVGILSGIAGYVLGGIQREPKKEQEA
jgi:hypothetical protein